MLRFACIQDRHEIAAAAAAAVHQPLEPLDVEPRAAVSSQHYCDEAGVVSEDIAEAARARLDE